MLPYLLVALGSAIGGMARFAMARAIDARWDGDFPVGTLAINVIGSFFIGVIASATDRAWVQQLLMIGVMGGYTTFSSFSLQTVRLLQSERWGHAAAYVAASVILCLIGTIVGLRIPPLFPHGAE